VALFFLVLAVASSIGLQRLSEQLALERLRSGLAPQILNQSSHRRLALAEAVRHVHQYYLEFGPDGPVAGLPSNFLAYHFWVTGELFHSGYKSSLDFYSSSLDPISHFGFDLPRFEEPLAPPESGSIELRQKSEVFDLTTAVSREVLHAEMPVVHDGELLGVVVGHVLNEPDNLPFLPWSQPYLAALGPGSPHETGEDLWGGPDYVLYDPDGRVVLNTMTQPPALTDDVVQAAERQRAIRLLAGDDAYAGLALPDGERLHLLLVPVHGLLERLTGAVRLSLAGLTLLVILSLGPGLLRPRRAAGLVGALRGSFYRKLLAAVLIGSVLPLIGLALFLHGYIERRADASLNDSAIRLVGAAGRALEDYAASQVETDLALDDDILYWLRRVVGQEIHVYDGGLLRASSKRELFASGLLPPRLDGDVHRGLVREGRPFLVVPTLIGARSIPVAYAPLFEADPSRDLVVAVPMVFEQRQIARAVDRVAQMLLLATVLLVGLLTLAAALLAGTVARPVRELVDATGRIAAGDYDARLRTRTRDEVADLVRGFNSMAASLAEQRADLERRKDYMETLLRHATTGVVSTDPEGKVVTLNPAARELLAPAAGSLREGVALAGALSESRELRPLAEALARGGGHGEPEEVDLDTDAQPRRFRVVRVELPGPPGSGTVGSLILFDDVTELMRSNQLAAWAEMARAIAHEIKNPLTPIQLSTEHLHRLLRDRGVLPSPELEACMSTVIKQVRNLHEIAGAFSAYAKLPELAPRPTDPVDFMKEAVEPYRHSSPPDVTIEERYEPAGRVSIDSKVLTRAVVNLVENALEAMPQGGRLTFSVGPDGRDGDSVVLGVSDTGTGLAPEARRRLFEPYFSTKSSGSGLGLAITRRVVEAHRGTIEVDSSPERGTTFRIVLPTV
jgi:signal transduction histidine kinase